VLVEAMTEALNAYQLSLLSRAAIVGHVSIVTAEERATLDELIAMKLVLGNQLLNLDGSNFGKPEDRWRG
jgi:hypothetical protein